MKIKILTVSILSLLFFNVGNVFGQNDDWKQIVVGQSNQAEVERILGKPRTDMNSDSVVSFFKVKDGNITIYYSTGPCKPIHIAGWDIEKGIVDKMVFYPSIQIKYKSLKLDKKMYKKTIEGDVADVYTYKNEIDGIEYNVYRGVVKSIIFFPGRKFDDIRCSTINNL